MAALTEYGNRPALVPDILYQWDTAMRGLETQYAQMKAAYNATVAASVNAINLNQAIIDLVPTINDNRSMKSTILAVFYHLGLTPTDYGYNPWPFVLTSSGWSLKTV